MPGKAENSDGHRDRGASEHSSFAESACSFRWSKIAFQYETLCVNRPGMVFAEDRTEVIDQTCSVVGSACGWLDCGQGADDQDRCCSWDRQVDVFRHGFTPFHRYRARHK